MPVSYSLGLVLLSYVVAVVASFVALDMAARVASAMSRATARLWLAAGAVAMGIGVWSMHFVGMLAFHLPFAVTYSVTVTLLSVLFAIAGSAAGLSALKDENLPLRLLVRSGFAMGAGIVAMHYTGMAAMQVRPGPHYDPWLVGVSALIAAGASMAALWIAHYLRNETILTAFGRKAGGAAIMGVAITGMHFTGMSAASFAPDSFCYGDATELENVELAMIVGPVTLVLLVATLLVALLDARLAERTATLAQRTAALVRSSEQNQALEERVNERTKLIRTSEVALLNMMEDATRARETAEAAYADLRSSMVQRQELEEQVREQASLLDKARDAIVVRDMEQRILYWNRGAERLYGWTAAEAMGRSADELLNGTGAASIEAFPEIAEHGEWSGRMEHRRRDGQPVIVEGHATLVRDDEGRPRSLLTISTDITKRVAMEESLQQSQRLEAVGQLTGGVAHDFNNLLTVILGNAEMLAEQLASQPRLRALAEMTRSAAQRGADLTHRLLAFARRQTLEPRAVDAGTLLTGMEGLLRRTLAESIALELDVPADLPNLMADPSQLENALLNLCINARDAMPGSGGRIVIAARTATLDAAFASANPGAVAGDYVRMSVSDTGKGIPPEHLKRVFEPFFTTKAFGKGTGLGLSMVYGFVKQSRGYVDIASEVGRGTTVSLYLPKADVPAATASPAAAESVIAGRSERVLLVEDEALLREYAEGQLSDLGYDVVSAPDGSAALRVIREGTPIDLLFTDVVMPGGMDGGALARAARTLRPGLRVLFTSGYTDNAVLEASGVDNTVHFLPKPYRRGDLAAKLRAVLAAPAA